MNTMTETPVRLISSAKSWIEGEAIRQLFAAAKLEGMTLAIGYPDLHPGKGSPVGAAFVSEGVIHPFLIGGDIGCGMAFYKTDLQRRKAKLDRWTELRFDLEHPWEGDLAQRLNAAGLESTCSDEAFGTLGGGNHFAELQAVEKIHDSAAFEQLGLNRSNLSLLVHAGSRGLGEEVLRDYTSESSAAGVEESSEAAQSYLADHNHALHWAKENRALLA
ncbi:MAG TPA: RtcB family protein, partial [Verrucomicrobiae bacterium]